MKAIDDLMVAEQRVLVRLDLNVPLNGGMVSDDARIRASLPTLRALAGRGAKVVVCAHLGRPGGKPDPAYSLGPVAERLSKLLGAPVCFVPGTVGPAVSAAVARLSAGDVMLLENLRFNAGETSKDDAQRGQFAAELADLADLYVDDAFGAVHRKHASVYDVALRLPHAAGYLIQAEVAALSRLTTTVACPYVVVLGGAKIDDKIGAIGGLIKLASRILIGGAMAFPFLAARGYQTGTSLLRPDHVALAAGYLAEAEQAGVEIVLPSDLVVAAKRAADASHQVVDASAIPPDQMGLDIGPRTAATFAAAITAARTAFWNGPMGVFELAPFAKGSLAVAHALTNMNTFSVIGGGDTAATLHELGIPEGDFGWVSTGGGASLEFVQGKVLPGLGVLQDR